MGGLQEVARAAKKVQLAEPPLKYTCLLPPPTRPQENAAGLFSFAPQGRELRSALHGRLLGATGLAALWYYVSAENAVRQRPRHRGSSINQHGLRMTDPMVCSVYRVRTKVFRGYLLGLCPTKVFGKVRYGLSTLPNTQVRFSTKSVPVPDTSVASVHPPKRIPRVAVNPTEQTDHWNNRFPSPQIS